MAKGRFDYVRYDDASTAKQARAKELVTELEKFIETFLPPGRPSALALTKLEEVYMQIGKSIRDHQIAMGGDSEDIAERTTE